MPISPSVSSKDVGSIALTGGIATGKSTVAKLFAALGAIVLDADEVARKVVQPGTPCWRQLRDLLGPAYFEENGVLKRRKLRERIIEDRQCRSAVNAILHPAILEQMDREWQTISMRCPEQVVIFDIPLLFEGDLSGRFDTTILVFTSREIQINRLMQRDSLSRKEAEETLTMQLPIEDKVTSSHLVIDNSYDLSHTRRQVRAVWTKLGHHGSL